MRIGHLEVSLGEERGRSSVQGTVDQMAGWGQDPQKIEVIILMVKYSTAPGESLNVRYRVLDVSELYSGHTILKIVFWPRVPNQTNAMALLQGIKRISCPLV